MIPSPPTKNHIGGERASIGLLTMMTGTLYLRSTAPERHLVKVASVNRSSIIFRPAGRLKFAQPGNQIFFALRKPAPLSVG
jgi:hypothetical protein